MRDQTPAVVGSLVSDLAPCGVALVAMAPLPLPSIVSSRGKERGKRGGSGLGGLVDARVIRDARHRAMGRGLARVPLSRVLVLGLAVGLAIETHREIGSLLARARIDRVLAPQWWFHAQLQTLVCRCAWRYHSPPVSTRRARLVVFPWCQFPAPRTLLLLPLPRQRRNRGVFPLS